jgi:hypothetical protein
MKRLLIAAALAATLLTSPAVGNDAVMALPSEQRQMFMAMAISGAGYSCGGTPSHEFKGMYEGAGYHLARCDDGSAYLVLVPADLNEEPTVLDCAIAKTLGADCFAKWE